MSALFQLGGNMRRSWYVAFLLVPVLAVMLFLVLPMVVSILPTFTRPTFGLGNYLRFFADEFNRRILYRSLRLSLITTLGCVILGLPTSYYLSMLDERRRQILHSVILFPLLTNAVVRGFAWIAILGRNGLLNSLLSRLHLVQAPVQMLYTEGAIVIGSIYLFLPVMVSTLVPGMERIGSETVEAAETLGAPPMATFFKVVVPMSFSGVLIAAVMVFAGTISAYTTPTLLGGSKNMMLATLLYQQSDTLANWDAASLLSCVMILCSLGVMKLFDVVAARLDKRG